MLPDPKMIFCGIALGLLTLVLVYLFMAIAASGIQELAARTLKLRAADLKRAILDLVGGPQNDGGNPAMRAMADEVYRHGLILGLLADGERPDYVPARNFAGAVLHVIDRTGPDFAATVALMPDECHLKTTLQAFLLQADGDMAAVRRLLECHFDAAMKRLSDRYARRSRTITFIAGLVVAVTLNVDTIDIFLTVSRDARSQLAQYGITDEIRTGVAPASRLRIPFGWTFQRDGDGCGDAAPLRQGTVGTDAPVPSPAGIIARLAGWLLTAAAAATGAPFWFRIFATTLRGGRPEQPLPDDSD